MKTNLTKTLENISYEPAEEIAKKYEAVAHTVDENFQTRIHNRVMTMINAENDKTCSGLK